MVTDVLNPSGNAEGFSDVTLIDFFDCNVSVAILYRHNTPLFPLASAHNFDMPGSVLVSLTVPKGFRLCSFNEQARKALPSSLALLVLNPSAHLLMQAWQLCLRVSDSAHSRKKKSRDTVFCIPGRIIYIIRGTTRIETPHLPSKVFPAVPSLTFNACNVLS